jgi:HPt (histidine-containing phosphotransfer) domain-containing protein
LSGKLAAIVKELVDGEDVMTAPGFRAAGEASRNGSTALGEPRDIGEPNVIDDEHLGRMTLGDRRLEREVLQIFVRQSAIMLERIAGGEPAVTAAAAHTLIGSARGVGAWRVAQAAERLERASVHGADGTLSEALAELKAASLQASAAIGARLSDPLRWASQGG